VGLRGHFMKKCGGQVNIRDNKSHPATAKFVSFQYTHLPTSLEVI
jgi:hypothetical protein